MRIRRDEYAEKLMNALYDELDEASAKYYNGLEEIMSDAVFDDKINTLSALENQFPQYMREDSPTKKVGYGGISESLEKVKHPKKMLSLDKRYDMKEIASFFEGMFPVVGSLKADGLTIVLIYQDGVLKDAVTRGDGVTGERVVKAVRTFTNLPVCISFKGTLVLRAEAVISQEQFARINEQLKKNGDDSYKNARNLASGTIRNLNPNVVAARKMQAYVFEVVSYMPDKEDEIPEFVEYSDAARRDWMEHLGFDCIEYQLLHSKEQMQSFYELVYQYRKDGYAYGTDGIVFCTDSIERKGVLGNTAKYPKYALAYKFPNKGEVSTVKSICWQVGMYSLTPVVIVDPIDFDGVTVQRATAHNLAFMMGVDEYGEIKRQPIVPGCQVKIERSGEVIPKITEVYFTKTDFSDYEQSDYPGVCPVCGADTYISGVELVCSNPNCAGKLKAKIRTMAARGALNITGMGKKTIDVFVDNHILQSMSDIFLLPEKKEEIMKLDGFGAKKYDKLVDEISHLSEKPLSNIINSLCIQGVGAEVARKIASNMQNGLIDLFSLSKDELVNMDDVGEVLATNITQYTDDPENIAYIAQLIHNGCGQKNNDMRDSSDSTKLSGIIICITGTLSVGRDEMEDFIRMNGGRATGSVSKKTTYVLVGNSPGASKVKKAEMLNIPFITEENLRKMVL